MAAWMLAATIGCRSARFSTSRKVATAWPAISGSLAHSRINRAMVLLSWLKLNSLEGAISSAADSMHPTCGAFSPRRARLAV